MNTIERGDKVKPLLGDVRSNGGGIVYEKQIVTVKAKKGKLFITDEADGIFHEDHFRKVSFPSFTQRNEIVTHEPTPAQGSRKTLKKRYEASLRQTLEWRNSYLCFAGTDNRIPNSPYVPSGKATRAEESSGR